VSRQWRRRIEPDTPPVPIRVLELGSYVAPAYAGMILAEQDCDVTKWVAAGPDPIQGLHRGDELWAWINHRKTIVRQHGATLADRSWWLATGDGDWWPDIIIDNVRPETLARWGVDPQEIAEERELVWVSLRSETPDLHDGRSFDAIAQARSWMEYGSWLPFYAGDTTAGLWVAFKALAMLGADRFGHHEVGQATAMQKLVEGELQIDVDRSSGDVPWDTELYTANKDGAAIIYRQQMYHEPVRDRAWKWSNLWHDGSGRMVI
jgi:crotonobetainyl-CoA:carnitine CoA-transferase CaiB-like acyl-CoA transferase